jgi:hypothetical protein
MSVIEQIERTFAPGRRLAAIVGTLLGGLVPLATFTLVHQEVGTYPMLWLMVAGGLAYSAISVFKWGRQAFQMPAKAIGFVLLLEGTVTFSHTHWLAITGLAFLIAINGVSAAVSLQATTPKPEQV